jgi:hypothetical protein
MNYANQLPTREQRKDRAADHAAFASPSVPVVEEAGLASGDGDGALVGEQIGEERDGKPPSPLDGKGPGLSASIGMAVVGLPSSSSADTFPHVAMTIFARTSRGVFCFPRRSRDSEDSLMPTSLATSAGLLAPGSAKYSSRVMGCKFA